MGVKQLILLFCLILTALFSDICINAKYNHIMKTKSPVDMKQNGIMEREFYKLLFYAKKP